MSILVIMLSVKYTSNQDSLTNQDLQVMGEAYEELLEITNVFDEQLDYLEENEECTTSLCGENATTIPRIYDSMIDSGCWNADSNTPVLLNGTGIARNMYIVCVAGNTTLDGYSEWSVDDILFFLIDTFNGNRWVRYGPETTSLVDSGGPDQTIIVNGSSTVSTWVLKQLANGGNGKISIDNSDPSTIVISLTNLATEEQLRTYPTLTGATTAFDLSGFSGATTPSIISERWIRRGDMLHGYFVLQVSLGGNNTNVINLGTFPNEILAEMGGSGSITTLRYSSVWCDVHRSFSSGTNDDYVYTHRSCNVVKYGETSDDMFVAMVGELTNIGPGVIGSVRLMISLVFETLGPFS
jgi:hypothetical protein